MALRLLTTQSLGSGQSKSLATFDGDPVAATAVDAVSAGVGDPVLVWRPGDPAGDHSNVFTQWTTLIAARNALNGPAWIALDGSFSSTFTVTAGAWNVDATTFVSLNLFQTITVATGATFTWTKLVLDACELLNASTTTPITVQTSFFLLQLNNGAQLQGSASQPAFRTSGTVFGNVQASRGAWIGDSGVHRSTLDIGAGGNVTIVANDGGAFGSGSETRIWQGSLTGAGTATVMAPSDGVLDFNQTITTLTFTFVDVRASVLSPNAPFNFTLPFSPGAGKILLVVDITPRASGKLILAGNICASGLAAIDQIEFIMQWVDLLTAITGGTSGGTGITLQPTSVTGAAPVSVAQVNQAVATPEAGLYTGSVGFNIPIQAIAGHRTGIVILASSIANIAWPNLFANVSVTER
jgi:hypothetical protein